MRSVDCCVNIRLIALRDARDHAPGRGFQRVELLTRQRRAKGAIDEMTKAGRVLIQPGARGAVVFRCRSVIHRVEVVGYAHWGARVRDDTVLVNPLKQLSNLSNLSNRMSMEGRIAAGDVMLE